MSFTTIVHNPFGAYDPGAIKYARWKGNNNVLMPFEFTDWVEETQSWKESCYISYSLSGITANLPVKGPDAERLMSENFVNSFTLDKFPVGRAKHVIAVSEKGNITMDGVVLRIAPDHFDTYCLDPQVPILVNSGRYNVEAYTPEYNRDFIFQLAGPRSLEIIENAARKDIHDLRFMAFTHVEIAGCRVRILRMGMGGTLGYEVHGSAEDAFSSGSSR